METKEIRLKNLMDLLEKHSSKQVFADHVDMAPAHVSQIVSGYRSMGNMIARRIEKKEGLPLGYMDTFHENASGVYHLREPSEIYSGDPAEAAEEKAFDFVDIFERLFEIKLTSKDKRELFHRVKARYLRQLTAGKEVPGSDEEMEAEVIDFIEITKQMKQ